MTDAYDEARAWLVRKPEAHGAYGIWHDWWIDSFTIIQNLMADLKDFKANYKHLDETWHRAVLNFDEERELLNAKLEAMERRLRQVKEIVNAPWSDSQKLEAIAAAQEEQEDASS